MHRFAAAWPAEPNTDPPQPSHPTASANGSQSPSDPRHPPGKPPCRRIPTQGTSAQFCRRI